MTKEENATQLAVELIAVTKKVMDNTQPADLFAALVFAKEKITPDDISLLLSFCIDTVKSAYLVGLFPPKFIETIFEELFKQEVPDVVGK